MQGYMEGSHGRMASRAVCEGSTTFQTSVTPYGHCSLRVRVNTEAGHCSRTSLVLAGEERRLRPSCLLLLGELGTGLRGGSCHQAGTGAASIRLKGSTDEVVILTYCEGVALIEIQLNSSSIWSKGVKLASSSSSDRNG